MKEQRGVPVREIDARVDFENVITRLRRTKRVEPEVPEFQSVECVEHLNGLRQTTEGFYDTASL